MRQLFRKIIIALIAIAPLSIKAETVTLILKNGTTLVGELISLDPTSVVEINVAGLNTKISFSDIEKIEDVETKTPFTASNQKSNQAKEKIVNIAGVDVKFLLIDGNTFPYGYDGPGSKNNNSEPVHNLTISSFYVSEMPVKASLYKAVTGDDFYDDYSIIDDYSSVKKKFLRDLKRTDINDKNKDICFFCPTINKEEIFNLDRGYQSEIVNGVPTAKDFIHKLKSEFGDGIGILTEGQWALINKLGEDNVYFPFYPEIVLQIDMNQSDNPKGEKYMCKGTYHDVWAGTISPFDNRYSSGIHKIDKKKKIVKLYSDHGHELIAPIHLVLPAK